MLHESVAQPTLNGLIVKYEAAQRQWQADKEAADRARGDGSTVGDGDTGAGGAIVDPPISPPHETTYTHFYAETQINPQRASKDVGTIANEVLAHFVDHGTPVTVTITIESTDPNGFDETTRRVVTENAQTLAFRRFEFE